MRHTASFSILKKTITSTIKMYGRKGTSSLNGWGVFFLTSKYVGSLVLKEAKKWGIPSLFDVCVMVAICVLPFTRAKGLSWMAGKSVFLVYSSIFLICLSMCLKPRREYKSIPLMILAVWSLSCVFRYNYYVGSASSAWMNWNLMNEGFIYVFFGVLLIRTVVVYAKAYRWYYIPIGMMFLLYIRIALIGDASGMWSMTPLMAPCMAVVVMLYARRKWFLFTVATLLAITLALSKWVVDKDRYIPWIVYKFKMRPIMWTNMIAGYCNPKMEFQPGLMDRPFGRGFSHLWNNRPGWFWSGPLDGWAFIQNDLIELGRNLGIIAMGCALWFFIDLLSKGKHNSVAYFFVLTVVCASMFQRTMHFPIQGGIVVYMISLLILENKGGEYEV